MQQEAPLLQRLGSAVSYGTLYYSDADSASFASHCFPHSLERRVFPSGSEL